MLKKTSDAPGLVIAAAEKYLGYQCRPGNVSVFGETVGYNGLTWSGSFIDVVFREAGFQLPACVYSLAAWLSLFVNGHGVRIPSLETSCSLTSRRMTNLECCMLAW
jgi:hypothetical protein